MGIRFMEKTAKKRIIFVIESFNLGGAEKSLVTLLNLLDYSKYEVELLLFAQGGAFQKLLPEKVTLLPVPDFFSYTSIPWHSFGKKLKKPKALFAQLRYSLALRLKKHTHIEKAALLWKYSQNSFSDLSGNYDVAIAYAQGIPTFFVAEKVKAKKKAAWINAIYRPQGAYLDYIKPFYSKFDFVNAVSDTVAQQIQETFALPPCKITHIMDILDTDFAAKMAEMPSDASADMSGPGTKILTVGRLCAMKGYDLAIDAARLLVERGLDFTWYVIGNGALREELERQIYGNGLKNRFILLGSRNNPYPYFNACDLYVQPSKHEGFGITLAEAKMFHKPIVTTNFEAVSAQFTNGVNGLIVDISAQGIADGILKMLSDTALMRNCAENLKKEKIGNTEEIEKFYKLIG